MAWWPCGGCECVVTQCTGDVPPTITVEISGVTGTVGCDDSSEINGTHVLTLCRGIVTPFGCLIIYGKTLTPIQYNEAILPPTCHNPTRGALLGCRIWHDFGLGADNDLTPYDETASGCSGVWAYAASYTGTVHGGAHQIASGEIAVDFMIENSAATTLVVCNTYVGDAGSDVCNDKLNMSLTHGAAVHILGLATSYNWASWTVAVST